MNEKHAGVPVLLYEKKTTYCFSDLSQCARARPGALARANDARKYAQ